MNIFMLSKKDQSRAHNASLLKRFVTVPGADFVVSGAMNAIANFSRSANQKIIAHYGIRMCKRNKHWKNFHKRSDTRTRGCGSALMQCRFPSQN